MQVDSGGYTDFGLMIGDCGNCDLQIIFAIPFDTYGCTTCQKSQYDEALHNRAKELERVVTRQAAVEREQVVVATVAGLYRQYEAVVR
ncbi:hypothetical protein DWB58_11640, partial [candidate division KSB1 bacterium]|nr:hypothetical protein [candidate division KSB1 bacterium]